MILNLKATTPEQEKIKAYLQNNATSVLADKINNGVHIVKDGKTLINKKTLDGFMEYAVTEARKLSAKGAKGACIDDPTVYGWAIRYFEQDKIQGKLFNTDGTEYQSAKNNITSVSKPTVVKEPKPQPKPQISIDDLLGESITAETPSTPIIPEIKQREGSPMYQHYSSVKEKYNDCIVFYRLGDFYEMFGEDAKISADILNLTLTGRDCGLAERVPMTGVPFHAADDYITKLVASGKKVVICEQLDGTSERTVERVIVGDPSEPENIIDEETGEIISVNEMQKFDGDIEEPEELPTVSKLLEGVDMGDDQDEPDDDFDIEKERKKMKAFDKNAIIILSDLLGNIFTLE